MSGKDHKTFRPDVLIKERVCDLPHEVKYVACTDYNDVVIAGCNLPKNEPRAMIVKRLVCNLSVTDPHTLLLVLTFLQFAEGVEFTPTTGAQLVSRHGHCNRITRRNNL